LANETYVIDHPSFFEDAETRLLGVDSREHILTKHVDESFHKAMKSSSKLPDDMTVDSVLGNIPIENRLLGFSGYNFRHLMNNLCSLPGANYLEIGVFRGSTLVSSLYGNEGTIGQVHAVDNFSEFNDGLSPKVSIVNALNRFLPNTKNRIRFHETDCFDWDFSTLPKIDIYFYDGEHSFESQKKAFTHFESVFADTFIAIVDDWEQRQVREGTKAAFAEIGYDVISARAVIPGTRPDNANRVNNPTVDWWCGTYVAVLKKRKPQ
jgi:hypothetical protein